MVRLESFHANDVLGERDKASSGVSEVWQAGTVDFTHNLYTTLTHCILLVLIALAGGKQTQGLLLYINCPS